MATETKAYFHGSYIPLWCAKDFFCNHHANTGSDRIEAQAMWNQCLVDESARDDWMPSELELVQA